jgi:hypothetical protein
MTSEDFQRRMERLYRRMDKLTAEGDGIVRHSQELIELNRKARNLRRMFIEETERMSNAAFN